MIGGILIIFMGIFQMEYINIPFIQMEKKINVQIKKMKPYNSFIFEFALSFGWTPCIGSMISSVLI